MTRLPHTPPSAVLALIAFIALATIVAIIHVPAVLCFLFLVSIAVNLSDGRKFRPPHK